MFLITHIDTLYLKAAHNFMSVISLFVLSAKLYGNVYELTRHEVHKCGSECNIYYTRIICLLYYRIYGYETKHVGFSCNVCGLFYEALSKLNCTDSGIM
jgi:hypothetical protein